MRKGLLIVVSGPSGTGKGTVCSALLRDHPEIDYSISATTRSPRSGEVDGKNYYFLTDEDFKSRIQNGGFLEYAEVYGHYYGTPLAEIEQKRDGGKDVLLEIDTQGALNVMRKCPEGVYIFLLPPSLPELERRIKGRGTETDESLRERLGAAEKEIHVGLQYQYLVVNRVVADSVSTIYSIIVAEHCRADKETQIEEVLGK